MAIGTLLLLISTGCVAGPRPGSAAAPGPAADAAPGNGDPVRGKALFTSRGCVGCHAVNGEFAGGATGPELRRALGRPTIAGTAANTPENLWHYLENPQRTKPGTQMPRVPLSGPELDDLVAYLQTLR